jgi:diguanylate cyclase (GGDEF)-like protein
MPDKTEIIKSIKQRTNFLTLIVLLIIFTLLFVNIRVLFTILNYISAYSVGILILIVSGLVLLGFYLSRRISLEAINMLDEYSDEINDLLISKEQEIAKRKKVEEELRELLLIDELTGIYNRRGFLTLVEHQLKIVSRMKRRAFLLYGDLDGLKLINDTYGHKEGDLALMQIAKILIATYRESDIIARIGGDEFVVFPCGNTEECFEIVSNRFQKNLDAYNEDSDRNYKLSMSLGITYYDSENPCSIDELLEQADKMMYEQKRRK